MLFSSSHILEIKDHQKTYFVMDVSKTTFFLETNTYLCCKLLILIGFCKHLQLEETNWTEQDRKSGGYPPRTEAERRDLISVARQVSG